MASSVDSIRVAGTRRPRPYIFYDDQRMLAWLRASAVSVDNFEEQPFQGPSLTASQTEGFWEEEAHVFWGEPDREQPPMVCVVFPMALTFNQKSEPGPEPSPKMSTPEPTPEPPPKMCDECSPSWRGWYCYFCMQQHAWSFSSTSGSVPLPSIDAGARQRGCP